MHAMQRQNSARKINKTYSNLTQGTQELAAICHVMQGNGGGVP